MCPYLALHGFPHAIHPTPSNSADAVPDASLFHRHPSGLVGLSTNDVLNSHGFTATEQQRHHSWQQASLPFLVSGTTLNGAEQTASQLASRLSRNDSAIQQRGSFVHPFPFVHG